MANLRDVSADDDDDDMGPALPFDTQFFHDDGDDGGDYDDLPMGGDEFEGGIDNLGAPYIPDAANNNTDAADRKESQEEEELLAATQAQVKRARPPLLSYAKTSKRVDVKKLKENIWRQLAIDVVPPKNKETNDEGDDTEDVSHTFIPQLCLLSYELVTYRTRLLTIRQQRNSRRSYLVSAKYTLQE